MENEVLYIKFKFKEVWNIIYRYICYFVIIDDWWIKKMLEIVLLEMNCLK